MEKLGWICLSLVSLAGPVWALSPMAMASDLSSWPLEPNEDARFGLEALNSQSQEPLRQTLTELLNPQADDSPSKAGLRPDSFQPQESIKRVLLTNLPRATFLSRLMVNNRKQYKKRGNLSECFWKYCV